MTQRIFRTHRTDEDSFQIEFFYCDMLRIQPRPRGNSGVEGHGIAIHQLTTALNLKEIKGEYKMVVVQFV